MAFVNRAADDQSMFRNPDDNFFSTSSSCIVHHDQGFHGSGQLVTTMGIRSCDLQLDIDQEALMSDEEDEGSQILLGEMKKRRLNVDQVKALEKSFESGNKLEPERKLQLARGLGLQPRQIAIWFQNRRARWKTKQLERDYDVLKRQFEALKSDNNALKSHNSKLQSQLLALKQDQDPNIVSLTTNTALNLNKENIEGCWSNGRDNTNTFEVNLNTTISTTPPDTALYRPCPNLIVEKVKVAAAGSFPLSVSSHLPPNPTQFLFNASSLALGTTDFFQNHKLNHESNNINAPASNQIFGSLYGNMEENQEFWSWPDQH